MATKSSHRLIMGKVEIFSFFSASMEIFGFFYRMIIELSTMFHNITFVQICVFDWLFGRQKGSIFVKMFKNLLLRNHIWRMKPKLGILA